MNEKNDIKENDNVKDKKKSERKRIEWKSIFSGSILQSDYVYKQRWYILLFFILSIIYISNRYIADKVLRHGIKLRLEAAEKKAEYVTKSSELMRLSKRSQVLMQIEKRDIDLKESKTPPKRVK
ncbi:MAG: hypothetical protein LBL90_03175 [Prevotellaceae bacterium]|jgi:hypothetical protein|nr:hypothetical protein [Prevotellaceae bacterium]